MKHGVLYTSDENIGGPTNTITNVNTLGERSTMLLTLEAGLRGPEVL